jgi:hypothetical protein
MKLQYELDSKLNDAKGVWLRSHGINRYRDWDELRYSVRSVEKYAGSFLNKIQILVNAVVEPPSDENQLSKSRKQRPDWLKIDPATEEVVQILAQEEFFAKDDKGSLPTFNSLTIENQLHNTQSDVDSAFALSDDMLLNMPHAASDIFSPLFGPNMGFKRDSPYNTVKPPTTADAKRFGEKPYLIYTSWLMNKRFGERPRYGQAHFGHSVSRDLMREALASFPKPYSESAQQRFRGEQGFQLYGWFATFHYTIERHREALLWSYIMLRSDVNKNGYLDWNERQTILADLKEGAANEAIPNFRQEMFYRVPQLSAEAGLEPPKSNIDFLWTSLDGPAAIRNLECPDFDVNECLAEGFASPSLDQRYRSSGFSAAVVFDRLARQKTKCGDCLLKRILHRVDKGLSPLLPHSTTHAHERAMVLKALMRYKYTTFEPDGLFVMVKNPQQAQAVLFDRFLDRSKEVSQICLNDDVNTEAEDTVRDVKEVISRFYGAIFPEKSSFETPN